MLSLLKEIRRKKRMRFEEIISEAPTKEEVVTFFLAVLELLKLGQMHIEQERIYGEIDLIYGRAEHSERLEEEPPEKKRKSRKRTEIQEQIIVEKGRQDTTVGGK